MVSCAQKLHTQPIYVPSSPFIGSVNFLLLVALKKILSGSMKLLILLYVETTENADRRMTGNVYLKEFHVVVNGRLVQ